MKNYTVKVRTEKAGELTVYVLADSKPHAMALATDRLLLSGIPSDTILEINARKGIGK